MMVHFRKRITPEVLATINDVIVNRQLRKDSSHDDSAGSVGSDCPENKISGNGTNAGVMMVDASVAPSDIAYPTDLNLLNEAREKLESIIDTLYEPLKGTIKKPRTYRQKARKSYLIAAKRRKMSTRAIRKAIKQQLQLVSRDIRHIEEMKGLVSLETLRFRHYRDLLVIHELYRQQQEMFDRKIHSVSDRIVNIAQPHIRPIVRGKASADVEFGAKIIVSRINGYHVLEDISWDNVNESTLLQEQIERYHDRMGVYPEAVLADRLYRNRDNLRFCGERNVRLSGPRLGRPGKDAKENKKQERLDSAMRNAIEGSFGIGKRRYGMNRIMMKLRETGET